MGVTVYVLDYSVCVSIGPKNFTNGFHNLKQCDVKTK